MTTHSSFENSPNSQIEITTSPGSDLTELTRKWEAEWNALEAIGFKTYPWKATDASGLLTLPVLNVDWLITQPSLPYLVQLLPTQLLYRSLQSHGLEDSLEVIENIRGESLVRLLDYDLWVNAQNQSDFLTPDEDLSADRFLQWVKLWNEISPDFAAERLMDLDEGVIIGCLTAVCEIVPVGLNRNQEELGDEYWITPDNKFGLRIKSNDEGDFEVIHAFVHSLYRRDIRNAQQVLSHCAMVIREEALEEARRWRNGRLEDQGFISSDEARSLLTPRTNKQLFEIVQLALKSNRNEKKHSAPNEIVAQQVSTDVDEESFTRVREFLKTFDDENLRQEMESFLGPDEICRLVGSTQPATEILVNDEDAIDSFVEKIVMEANTLLARLEAHNAKAMKLHADQPLTLLFDRAMRKISEYRPEIALAWKSRLARTTNILSIAMGVANEPAELARVLAAVRGCLNIGLERLVLNPRGFGLESLDENEKTFAKDDQDEFAVSTMIAVGPEAIFQVGWQSLQEIAHDALTSVLAALKDTLESDQHKATYEVQLNDGSVLNLPVLQRWSRGRYLEVRKWLSTISGHFPESVSHVLSATINRLPVFPIILLEETGNTRGSTDVVPYETIKDLEITRNFFEKLVSVQRAMGRE